MVRRIENQQFSTINKHILKETSQNYKKTMTYHITQFNRKMHIKLRNLKTKNSEEFWKIINSIERNNEEQTIDLKFLYTFFRKFK